jgi:plasmid stabilization system protein ParE
VARVDRTAQSVQDEFNIALYIARDNPPAAKRLLKLIHDQLQLLAEFPGMASARRSDAGLEELCS